MLTIYGLAEEDLGEYVCVAENEAGLGASHAMVAAGVRPLFTTYPEPTDATEPQKPVVLKCQAKGNPAPAIKWYKDGLLIIGTPEESRFHITMEGSLVFMGKRYHITREGYLIIFEPRVEDEGTYKCEAENELGKVSYEVSLYVEMSAKCDRGCKKGGVCKAVKYDCVCSRGFYKKGDQCIEEKKTKAIAVAEEMGSGSGSGSGSGPDNGGSGSGHQEYSGDWTSGSGQERPTNPTTAVPSGAGVDQEESGDESSSKEGSGKERQDESAGGESDDGSFEAWQPVKEKSRNRRRASAEPISPLDAPPS